jgi:uncharacterized protein
MVSGELADVWSGVALLMIVLGVAGAVIPVLPGPLLIWAGALLWAWADGFTRIGWGTLIVLALLALVAWGADLFLTTVMSRRAGASWRAILGSIAGGLVGAMLLTWVPVLGTVLGAILGAMAGMWAVEYWLKGSVKAATASVQAYVSSMVLAAIVEMTIALIMVAIFAVRAYT